jgi:hypothetical protein
VAVGIQKVGQGGRQKAGAEGERTQGQSKRIHRHEGRAEKEDSSSQEVISMGTHSMKAGGQGKEVIYAMAYEIYT